MCSVFTVGLVCLFPAHQKKWQKLEKFHFDETICHCVLPKKYRLLGCYIKNKNELQNYYFYTIFLTHISFTLGMKLFFFYSQKKNKKFSCQTKRQQYFYAQERGRIVHCTKNPKAILSTFRTRSHQSWLLSHRDE